MHRRSHPEYKAKKYRKGRESGSESGSEEFVANKLTLGSPNVRQKLQKIKRFERNSEPAPLIGMSFNVD